MIRKFFAVMVPLVLVACVPAVPVAPSAAPVPRGATQWLVESGDVIRLRVWLAADQSGDLPVNERGQILIPTVGRLQVAGLTPIQAESQIIRSLSARLDSSRVEVTFLRPVAVLGGVRGPGVQLADPSATVLSLIARAGGPTRPGGELRAYLLRIGEPVREISTADRVADLGIRASDQLYAQDPPFAVRNEIAIRLITEVVSIVGSLVTIVLLITRK